MIRPRRPVRPGFTLIELLVVIAIIAVLVSLLSAGVMAARGAALRTQAKSDIQEMTSTLEAGMTRNNNRPLPSRLILCETISNFQAMINANNANSADAQLSYAALCNYFSPRIGPVVNWNGDGHPSGRTWILEGEEALVFWCGGIPGPSGPSGFVPGALDPSGLSTGTPTQRLPMNFNLSRLSKTGPNGSAGFMVYSDPYGVPYAYFATKGAQNNYQGSDCQTLLTSNGSPNFSPYYTSLGPPIQYANPASFQIISAGRDTIFGVGHAWSPQTGILGTDADNITNFAAGNLGGGQ